MKNTSLKQGYKKKTKSRLIENAKMAIKNKEIQKISQKKGDLKQGDTDYKNQ